MKPPVRSLRALLGLLLIGLFLTVESSLQGSIVFARLSAWWTPWLYKIGPLSIADLIIIATTIFAIAAILSRGTLPRSPYLAVCGVAGAYLLIGLIYNVMVFPLWKTYLFDVKVVMYFTVPYLFLYVSSDRGSDHGLVRWFSPPRLFAYTAMGAIFDYAIVAAWGDIEYMAHFGLPVLPFLVVPAVSLVGLVFARTIRYRVFFMALLALEIVNAINRGSLGLLFTIVPAGMFIAVLRIETGLPAKAGLILLMIAFINGAAVIMIANPLHWSILEIKPEGALTRSIQLQNVLMNFDENIPGVIGKGLGSTWFERVPTPSNDVFAVGTSVGSTTAEAMSMPVKFIFNWSPPALLHKWGLIGTALLAWFVASFYQSSSMRLRQLRVAGCDREGLRYLYALLILTCVFAIDNFTWPGNLKPAMTTSMLAFFVEHEIRQRRAKLGPG